MGSCLTQMSDAAPRATVTAIDLPSGASASSPMFPCGSQVESIGAAAPLRVTHQVLFSAALPPEVYTRVPLFETPKLTSNGPVRSMPSITATAGPVSARLTGSNGTASSLPSPVTTSRWPEAA